MGIVVGMSSDGCDFREMDRRLSDLAADDNRMRRLEFISRRSS